MTEVTIGGKRARTRARLLAAARDLVRDKGYGDTTLQDVARKAGLTIGAIYGNFRSRDELFVALGEAYWAPIKPQFRAGSSFADKMRALAEATLAVLPARADAAIGRLNGMAQALGNEQLRAGMHERTARAYAEGAAWLRATSAADDLPMPAEQLVRVVHALSEGLVMQRLLTPELVPDEVFYAAFAALAARLNAPEGRCIS